MSPPAVRAVARPFLRFDALLLAAGLLVGTAAGHAATIRVPTEFPTIQSGLDVAGPGDTVLVEPGTYVENLSLTAVHDGVTLLGELGPDSTVIDGGENTSVIRCREVGSTTRIEGFTITNGRATSVFSVDIFGGGLFLEDASPRIEDNVIEGNVAHTSGGGLFLRNSSPVIANNVIRDNGANNVRGGGIYAGAGCAPWVSGNEITDNTAWDGGGGVALVGAAGTYAGNEVRANGTTFGVGGGFYLNGADSARVLSNHVEGNGATGGAGLYVTAGGGRIEDNEIVGNTVPFGTGAGLYCHLGGDPLVIGNLVAENGSGGSGGGVSVWESSFPRLERNTIVANTASQDGAGIHVATGASPVLVANLITDHAAFSGVHVDGDASLDTVRCNDVWNNEPNDWSGVPDPAGDGNFSADPLYCEPASGDYGIADASPCAAGSSPAGCGRVGARDPSCGVTGVGRGGSDRSSLRLRLVPNPFRDRARVRFELSAAARVRVTIHDVAGRLVRQALDDAELGPGAHRWSWDGRDDAGRTVAAGVYWVRVVTSTSRASAAVLRVR